MIRIDKNDPKNDPLLAALAGVGVILTFAALIAVYGLPFKYLPEVMIGEEGLREMQKYLHILLLGQVLVLVGLPALYLLFSVLYHRVRNIPLRPLFIAGPIAAGLLFSFMVVPVRLSGVEAQCERFSGGKLQRIIHLLDAVNRDMDAEPVVVCADEELWLYHQQYSHSYSGGRGNSRPSYINEYILHEKEGYTELCQISAREYQEIKPGINSLAVHTVRCYPNSGLLYDIDGGAELLTEEELLATIYNITYDDRGYIHWEGPLIDAELGNLGMNYYIDGELRLVCNAEKRNIDDPLFIDGHDNSAYLTAVYKNHYRRVSNILNVTDVIEPVFGTPTDTPGVFMAEKDAGARINLPGWNDHLKDERDAEDEQDDGEDDLTEEQDTGDEQDSENADADADSSTDDGPAEWEPDPEVTQGAGGNYLITADELLIKEDNPYYSNIMNVIDALADAPEITVGKEFKRWSPIAGLSLKHSNGETDFVVYMNIDIEKYEAAPQSEADVYFRINGKLRGESIVRYLAFEPELKILWDILVQIKYSKNTK